jgi:hypothetical protein
MLDGSLTPTNFSGPIPPGNDENIEPKLIPVGEADGDFIFISDVDGAILIDGNLKVDGDLEIEEKVGFYGIRPVNQYDDIMNPDCTLHSLQESVNEILSALRHYNLLKVNPDN